MLAAPIPTPGADPVSGASVSPLLHATPHAVVVDAVVKEFTRGDNTLRVLDEVSLTIPAGCFAALMGPSGSGKTTLLNLIAGLDRPTAGSIQVDGINVGVLNETQLADFRSQRLGFIFQRFNLIPVLTARENVELPLLLFPMDRAERRARAEAALRIVGLEDRMEHLPKALSGGQEQRVGIARAVVTDPSLLLADEPTGNLDAASARDVLDLLSRLSDTLGKTIVMVTHDPHGAARAEAIYHLEKGRLLSDVESGGTGV